MRLFVLPFFRSKSGFFIFGCVYLLQATRTGEGEGAAQLPRGAVLHDLLHLQSNLMLYDSRLYKRAFQKLTDVLHEKVRCLHLINGYK